MRHAISVDLAGALHNQAARCADEGVLDPYRIGLTGTIMAGASWTGTGTAGCIDACELGMTA